MSDVEHTLTTTEAAQYLGISTARIRQLVGSGRLQAERSGKTWLIDKSSLDKYAALATPGRPKAYKNEDGTTWKPLRPVSYTLMSRNHEVAHLIYDPAERQFSTIHLLDKERAPLALVTYQAEHSLQKAMNEWWGSRGIPESRDHLSRRLQELSLRSAFELPLRSYGLSLSDQYWLRPDHSTLNWEDVSFFRNSYDLGPVNTEGEPSSHAGMWLNATGLKSPDNTTDGMLNKRWIFDEEGRRVLIKGNGPGGREAYNEVIATMLYRRLLPASRYVEYRLGSWHGQDVSVCETFLRDDEEFIPAWYVYKLRKKPNNFSDYRHYCETCEDLGAHFAQNQLDRMLVCDSILANTDRHWGNFGIIRNVETLECRPAPIFDTGTSLWSHKLIRELAHGDYSFATKPFYKEPRRQLHMVIDGSWYHPEALEGFVDEVRDYLTGIFPEANPAPVICKGLTQRIEAVNFWYRQAPTTKVPPQEIEPGIDVEKLIWVWL